MKLRALLFCLALAVPAYAQPATPTGYDQLVTAGKLILPGENGSPSATPDNLSPAENLSRQRAAVARNAPALKAVREALKQPIVMPLLATEGDLKLVFAHYGNLRELARQFRQESAVRAADRDWTGALDSRLTALGLGNATMQGADYMSMMVSAAVNSIALKDIQQVALHLDAASSRTALTRLSAMEASRAPFVEITEVEKKATLIHFTRILEDMAKEPANEEWRKKLATLEGRLEADIPEAEAAELLALTPETMKADMTEGFDAIMKRDRLPYHEARKIVLPPAKRAFAAIRSQLQDNRIRFVYERSIAEQRLFMTALELHAIKAETGGYPENFETPVDPFGSGTRLVYKRGEDKYLLYSVGPDGVDNGGAGLQNFIINPQSGAAEHIASMQVESTGDIVSAIF